jgi:hypothetical protein
MQSSYAHQNFKLHLTNADLKSAWNLYLTISTGNAWIKKHGVKYAPEIAADELEDSIRLKHFARVYKNHRRSYRDTISLVRCSTATPMPEATLQRM